jgi:hypothetical protein
MSYRGYVICSGGCGKFVMPDITPAKCIFCTPGNNLCFGKSYFVVCMGSCKKMVHPDVTPSTCLHCIVKELKCS